MRIKFLGATGTVTGSRYLLSVDNKNFLIDCGLFQGYKELRLRNWERFPIDPRKIHAVILTHAHLDHSGYLPLLIKNGFRGKVFCTAGTEALCKILLPDSGHLQEEEAKHANKFGYSKHAPALALYTRADAVKALSSFEMVSIGKSISLTDNLCFYFRRVGHIIGACSVIIKYQGKTIIFSGDVGRQDDIMMIPPRRIPTTDYLVLESTYGGRLHEKIDPQPELCKFINEAVKRGGTIVVPAFAVGRTQLLLYYIYQLLKQKLIPPIPVYLDSPTAIEATNAFCQHTKSTKFSPSLARTFCNVAKYIHTPDESKAIDRIKSPKIIVSASGMATGGRVLHHLKVFLPDEKSTILLTGYQSPGTRGARLQSGETELKLFGEIIPVRAKIETLHNVSAHSDYEELLTWLSSIKKAPKKIFITHGELEASKNLKAKIEEHFGWNCCVPEYLYEEEL